MKLSKSKPVLFAWHFLEKELPEGTLEQVFLFEDPAQPDQGYELTIEHNRVEVRASAESGMMYALLDLADIYDNGWPQQLHKQQTPYIRRRGIKFNIPLDARTPSYSDASTSAFENIPNMWQWDFWQEFLDTMAREKLNVLSLWSLSPFPSLVRIPEYPELSLQDVVRSTVPPRPDMSGAHMWTADMEAGAYPVLKLTIDEKIAFWQKVMAYARDRCIDIYLFTWNLFLYGVEGIPWDQKNPKTRDYLYRAVKALLKTYPLLAGIGITAGENMAGDDTDIPFLRQTYGRAVEEICQEEPNRKIELIQRMQYARYPQIREQFRDFGGSFAISFKYAQAHIHSWEKPAFFQKFLEETGSEDRFWLTVRDDDYYLYRWCDPDFAKALFENMPAERIEGFYLGADGFTWGRDYTGYDDRHPLYLKKMWGKTALFGQLSYDPQKGSRWLQRRMAHAFASQNPEPVFRLWSRASQVFRTLQAVHWNDYDFQWYPEGCCRFLHPPVGKLVFSDINEFLNCPAMPGTPFLSVRDYCRQYNAGQRKFRHDPMSAVRLLRDIGAEIAQALPDIRNGESRELADTLADIRAMGLLADYYADKLEAAVELCFYRMDRSQTHRQEAAVALLERAAPTWKAYSAFSKSLYRPQRLTRMGGQTVDFTGFDPWADLDIDLAKYQ